MNLSEYSLSVVSRSTTELSNNSAIDIAAIIAQALSILSMFPCTKAKTAEEKREWTENHTNLAVAVTMREFRKQARGEGEKLIRSKARELAETVVNDYLSTSDQEINKLGISL